MKNESLHVGAVRQRPGEERTAVGLCLGASTVSVVLLRGQGAYPYPAGSTARPRILHTGTYPHDGNPQKALTRALAPLDPRSFTRIAATGRRFRRLLNLSSIPEPQAVEYGYPFVKPEHISCPAVVSAGGETFMVYVLNASGRITNVLTGNKCASGTGEFFLQQLRRMDVTLEEAARWSASESPHYVSGRCSVFCKSDCTHATNKGVPREKVTAGLCKMMADKILELLKGVDLEHVMVTGGTALNPMMIGYLREAIPGLVVPSEAPYFEALGAALWALNHETADFPGMDRLIKREKGFLETLACLRDSESMVTFKSMPFGEILPGDGCTLGLDVGSTTTKAVLMRNDDRAILASIYLRTNGDPVGASRKCYRAILDRIRERVDPGSITIDGMGVCGSGRQIAGLHAMTDGIINEIIAHATAAVHFDPQVDTLFEIGGQDAKYTYIINGVPSDYAMNEACSAGTGSFLEESALETLGVEMDAIAAIALKGKRPPNFNDQCAAFIASDIKHAIHEGIGREDIVAGLVYSVCMNYANRVKGNRPVGNKIFMQGGVCYNRAVPLAMAALVGKPIIVPPEPGLMGAFGVALAVRQRMAAGLLAPRRFDLDRLINREVGFKKSFVCKGGKAACDRRCTIAMVAIEGKQYPFGGACNRYYNLRRHVRYDVEKLDLVRMRQRIVFEGHIPPTRETTAAGRSRLVGLNKSFLVNTYYPLYATFFTHLGFVPVLPRALSQKGVDHRNAAFCYPAELAHGFFHTLLNQVPPPAYIFLPHFKAVPTRNGNENAQVCPLVQGETFYLRTTFRKRVHKLEKQGTTLLTPLIDLAGGLSRAEAVLVETAEKMKVDRRAARRAFKRAVARQKECQAEMKRIGRKVLSGLESEPDRICVVLFGRSYSAFAEEAHMGIPNKFASRGIQVLPFDFLSSENEKFPRHMYWGMGQRILMAARIVKRHPQLFGTYITNFSCGPDSFLLGYFREIMGQKPSLTLELDSHTADAGIETRIDAFLDIVSAHRQLVAKGLIVARPRAFRPARVVLDRNPPRVMTSAGEQLPLTDPRVTVLLPSMGRLGTEAFSAVFQGLGFNARAHPPADENILKLGRGNTSCKECLPLILTTGTLLNYVQKQKKPGEVLVYFMATGSGPCRFGQYYIFMEALIKQLEIPDVALFTLTGENAYMGMDRTFEKRGWWGIVISDVMEDIRSMLLAGAKKRDHAQGVFKAEWMKLIDAMRQGDFSLLERRLAAGAERLGAIPMKRPSKEVPTIALIGEIFVRRDGLSRRFLTERLAKEGFATICSPVAEWIHYSNFMAENGYAATQLKWRQKLRLLVRNHFMRRWERQIKTLLARSGLVHDQPLDIGAIISAAADYLTPDLQGEAILTVGSALTEVGRHACGVIAIGPFGCMPNRLSEALLNEVMTREDRLSIDPANRELESCLGNMVELPFLAIESDGSPFPQLIEAKLEAFCLRAARLHRRMMSAMD